MWDLRAWLRRLTLRPRFSGLTFSLKISHSLPLVLFDARNSLSGSIVVFLISASAIVAALKRFSSLSEGKGEKGKNLLKVKGGALFGFVVQILKI